jgi:uroporphyrinogen decarboxylase
MPVMSSRERVQAALDRRPVDRLPCHEGFWSETVGRWRDEGHLGKDEWPEDHFDLDIRCGGWPNHVVDMDFVPVVLEETEETKLTLDGNGAKLRWMKNKGNCPEHIGFAVMDRRSWEEHARPGLTLRDKRRIPFESYREARAKAARNQRFFCWSGIAPFECMHPLCGHENMLMGMAMDPEWVMDMVKTYADLVLWVQEELFAAEGKPDGIWYYEDMGFKGRPFMSPEMYGAIVQPGHARLFGHAHSLGLKVIVHSCGYVAPLVPGLIAAGMDCLQAMEVKAGMDVLELAKKYGDRIAFFGGLDVRELISNDTRRIDAEMDKKIPALLAAGSGYIVHSDHSVPSEVEYRAMEHWYEKARSYSTGRR